MYDVKNLCRYPCHFRPDPAATSAVHDHSTTVTYRNIIERMIT